MSNQVLIYGAGNNAKRLWGEGFCSKKIKKIFDNSVGFLDKDIKKRGKIFLGKKVYLPEEGIKKFPGAKIFISLCSVNDEVVNDILKLGVNISQVINLRRTCDYLEYFLVCGYHEAAFGGKIGKDAGCHSIKPCCSDYGKNNVDYVLINGDISDAVDRYLQFRHSLLEKLKRNEDCCCTNCRMLKWTVEDISSKFYYIIFNEMGRCNCKCLYCNYKERLGRDVSSDVDVVELYEIMCKKGFDESEGIVELCNGEITIHPDKKRIYEALSRTNIMFLTNGLIKDEEIFKRLQNGKGILNVSIDSGTKNTFMAIKGVDGYERVKNNLRYYAKTRKGKIYLKYILLPGINDNQKDMDGFVGLCKELSVDMAHVSYDLNKDYSDYNNPKTIKALRYLVNMIEENNISYEIYSEGVLEALLKESRE